jgi:chromosome segregation ATPase
MSLTLAGINMWNQYTTNKLQIQIISQQSKIQSQQSEIQKQQSKIQSQQQELQKYQTKVQQQEHQIQEKDSTIQSQNQTLQHEKMKKKSDTPSKQDSLAYLAQQGSTPLTYDAKSIRINFDNIQTETNKIFKEQPQKMKIKQTNIDQRVQQAIEAYQVNQISTQIPRLASMTIPLNLLA